MNIDSNADTLRLLGALFDGGTVAGLSDGQLLERFAQRRDQAAELAFAELVRRHGPMVLRVCRAALRDEHDAQDAIQATFLVLVHKAGSLRVRDSLGPWLHAVALRITACARATAARRRAHERRSVALASRSISDEVGDDQGAVLHEEIGRLPERFRTAVVLCDLEGLTHQEAARQLGWPVGTVKSRQARGRERLRGRLIRRGLAPSAGGLAVALSEKTATATVPAALAEATVQLAMRVWLGKTAMAGLVSASIITLVGGGLRTMLLAKLKLGMLAVLAATLVTTGVAVVAYSASGQDGGPAPQQRIAQGNDPKGQEKNEPLSGQGPPGASRPSPKEDLYKLLHEFDATYARRSSNRKVAAKSVEDRNALSKQFEADFDRINGRFLDLAVRNPRTDVAEQALIWLLKNARLLPEGERARQIMARDHARSDRLGSIFGPDYNPPRNRYSQAAEDLLRNALDQNPYRDIRGLACYWLADYLSYQAMMVRLLQLLSPAQREEVERKARLSREDGDRLIKKDPNRLEEEAARLYRRVLAEFSNVENNDTRSMLFLTPPFVLGKAARAPLDALRRLSVGKQAPEIEGLDLDGKPLRLSDYRGKVVVLYVDGMVPMRSRGPAPDVPAPITTAFPALARKMEAKPLIFLGIVAGTDREAFKKTVQASGLSARFWWDPDQEGKPGPLREAWDAHFRNVYLIDPRGIIRYTRLYRVEELERAASIVLEEMDTHQVRDRKDR